MVQGYAAEALPAPVVTQPVTMSSLEIAELTGKAHKNVLADIRKMLEGLDKHSAEFSAQYKDPTGRSLQMFNLPKDLTITLVSGYSVQMRHRIVTRWLELEEGLAEFSAHPQDPVVQIWTTAGFAVTVRRGAAQFWAYPPEPAPMP